MKKIIIMLLAVMAIYVARAQQVITTSGQSGAIPGYTLDWTLGETVIESMVGTNNILTQGFHQTMLMQVTYPSQTGLVWNPDTIYEITWRDFTGPYVMIELLKGSEVVQTISSSTANDGSLSWPVPELEPGTDYRIRITSTSNPAMSDVSDNYFSLANTLTAISGETETGGNILSIYPNPFASRVTITYNIAQAGKTVLEIYDLTGRRVTTLQDGTQVSGSYVIGWNGADARGKTVVPGVYLIRFQSGTYFETGKIVFSN